MNLKTGVLRTEMWGIRGSSVNEGQIIHGHAADGRRMRGGWSADKRQTVGGWLVDGWRMIRRPNFSSVGIKKNRIEHRLEPKFKPKFQI
jgi:hypothetical protein